MKFIIEDIGDSSCLFEVRKELIGTEVEIKNPNLIKKSLDYRGFLEASLFFLSEKAVEEISAKIADIRRTKNYGCNAVKLKLIE
jgi:hypothetical protein